MPHFLTDVDAQLSRAVDQPDLIGHAGRADHTEALQTVPALSKADRISAENDVIALLLAKARRRPAYRKVMA